MVKYFKTNEEGKKVLVNENEEVVIQLLQTDTIHIIDVVEPTIDMQLLVATGKRPSDIQFIGNLADNVIREAIKKYPYVVQYLPEISERLLLVAARANGRVLEFLLNPSIKVQLAAVRNSPYAIEFCEPNDELIQVALEGDPASISVAKGLKRQFIISAIRVNPQVLNLLKNREKITSIDGDDREYWLLGLLIDPTLIRYLTASEQIENFNVVMECIEMKPEVLSLVKDETLRNDICKEAYSL